MKSQIQIWQKIRIFSLFERGLLSLLCKTQHLLLFKKLAGYYITFTALHSASTFLNEQKTLWRTLRRQRKEWPDFLQILPDWYFGRICTESGHTPDACELVLAFAAHNHNGELGGDVDKVSLVSFGGPLIKPKDLLLICRFVHRMKGSKRKMVNGQILEKAANIGPFLTEFLFAFRNAAH